MADDQRQLPLLLRIPASRSSRAMVLHPLRSCRYLWKMSRTTSAPSGLTVILPPITSYPSSEPPKTTPFSMLRICPHLERSEVLRLSSCAKELMIVSRSSPSLVRVSRLSLRNSTPTPRRRNSRVICSASTVLRVKRLTSLVTIRSICPSSAAWSILLNSTRLLVDVPENPSSA